MHEADEEGSPAGAQVVVTLAAHRFGVVQVRMDVSAIAVAVDVMVQRATRPDRAQQIQPEDDQHHGHAELERGGESRRDLGVQADHGHRGGE